MQEKVNFVRFFSIFNLFNLHSSFFNRSSARRAVPSANIWGHAKYHFVGRGGVAGTSAEAELWHRTERTPTRGAPLRFSFLVSLFLWTLLAFIYGSRTAIERQWNGSRAQMRRKSGGSQTTITRAFVGLLQYYSKTTIAPRRLLGEFLL